MKQHEPKQMSGTKPGVDATGTPGFIVPSLRTIR